VLLVSPISSSLLLMASSFGDGPVEVDGKDGEEDEDEDEDEKDADRDEDEEEEKGR